MAVAAIGVAGLALAAIGTGVQFAASRRQAKAQEKAAERQQALQELQARRERRRVIREGRIARAAALNVASQTGAGQSSAIAGGLSGVSSQVGAELGFSLGTEQIGQRITQLNRRAARAGQLGAIGGGIADIGSTLFSNRRDIVSAFS